ncbi:MAG: hypothetical protein IPL55_20680 [Saprospiraceae bacterium]|jgi:hypothetical protein|nr:hypothetical protein [Saprospiraceae bacterium]MBL0026550.1 hypothetical protein [Saprospiraceae bacterium]
MKYRRLSNQELESFEKEFIGFLVVNGIDADEWINIKKTDLNRTHALLEEFSDVILEGILTKIMYIEYFGDEGLKLFKCDENTIFLIGIEPPNSFTNLETMVADLSKHPDAYSIYYTSKDYIPDRNTELFRMIQSGGLVSNGHYYNQFSKQEI